jgi:pheromone shutdown-related protein TraB
MENLRIIGTSHVAKQSLEEVKAAILEDRPDILALELDPGRLQAILSEDEGKHDRASIFQIGLKGYAFFVLGRWLQKKIGKIVGMEPGSEMKLAIELAKKHNIKIALIDRDIRITLSRLSKSIKGREKWNLLVDFFKGIFSGKKEMRELGIENIDLSKVPDEELIEKLIDKVRERYPGAYSSLIEERNQHMTKNLIDLASQAPEKKILAIIGAGHKRAIEHEIQLAFSDELAIAG